MGDLEDSIATLDQGRIQSEAIFQCSRQTGSAGLVVSNNTVLNLNISHRRTPE